MNRSARIYVAGGDTLIGAALLHRLRREGYENLVGVGESGPDLTVSGQVEDFFGEARPEYVFFAAGKSGGIGLNRSRPAELMLDNLLATAHVVHASHEHRVTKLLYLSSSCSYPRDAIQPLTVRSLLGGPPEPTSAPYAVAKLAGWQLCAAYRRQYGSPFITGIPANAFGPQDDFSAESGHVIPALMRRTHEAWLAKEPQLTVWGTGVPRREFIYSADLADACVFVMRHYDGDEPINLGGGECRSIAETAAAIADVVGYRGRLIFDSARPDGASLKMLDSEPLRRLGWRPTTSFRTGLARTYRWFRDVRSEANETTDVGAARSAHL